MKFDWQELVEFHGHSCPGLALGYGMVRLAMQELGLSRDQDEEVVAISETDACSVDALQFILGCTLGKGNLIYHNTGKNAFTIFCRKDGRSIRVMASSRLLEADSKEDKVAKLLEADPKEYCQISKARYPMPGKARLFNSVTCQFCEERLSENMARLQDDKIICLDCLNAYERGY